MNPFLKEDYMSPKASGSGRNKSSRMKALKDAARKKLEKRHEGGAPWAPGGRWK